MATSRAVSTAWLELKDQRITADRGVGATRLAMVLTCVVSADVVSDATPYDLRGEVRLEAPNSSPRYLTRCFSARPFWFREGNKAELTVYAELTPHQLEEVEDLRAGGMLVLVIDFTVWAVGSVGGRGAVLDGHHSRLAVEPALWAQTLAQAGVAEELLLVVPTPPASSDRKIIEAWNSWQKARDALVGGRWPDAVGASRKVVDLLGYTKEPEVTPMKRTKAQRWHSLGYAFFRLTSAPNHGDDVTIEMEWTRDDAIGAVAVAGGLLRAALPPARP